MEIAETSFVRVDFPIVAMLFAGCRGKAEIVENSQPVGLTFCKKTSMRSSGYGNCFASRLSLQNTKCKEEVESLDEDSTSLVCGEV